jgi:hypothetical protein
MLHRLPDYRFLVAKFITEYQYPSEYIIRYVIVAREIKIYCETGYGCFCGNVEVSLFLCGEL